MTAEDGEPLEITRHDMDVIRWERVQVGLEGVIRFDEILDRFQDGLEAVLDRHNPKPVVARVEFSGQTDLHPRIAADPEHIKESVRSTAMANFGDRAWIEKVKVRTTPRGKAVSDPGPLRELGVLVDDLMSIDTDLLALGKSLSVLFQKLRPITARVSPDSSRTTRSRCANWLSRPGPCWCSA